MLPEVWIAALREAYRRTDRQALWELATTAGLTNPPGLPWSSYAEEGVSDLPLDPDASDAADGDDTVPPLRPTPSPRRDAPATGTHAIGVLDREGLWRPGGDTLERGTMRPIAALGAPPTHVADLFALARATGLEQLWVHPSWMAGAGLPGRLPRDDAGFLPRDAQGHFSYTADHPFFSAPRAVDAGWDISPPGKLAWWLHGFLRGSFGAVDLAVPQYQEQRGRWPWGEAADGRELLVALRYFTDALGTPLRRSPGSTGTQLMRAVHQVPHGLSIEAPDQLPEPALRGGTEVELVWLRPLTPDERGCRFVHAYDKNAMFLGACSSLALGTGEAVYVEASDAAPLVFDKRLPGYWLAALEQPETVDGRLPVPWRRGRAAQAGPGQLAWYTTPTLDLANELGAVREIRAAYVWHTHHQVLAPWYKRLRDARTALAPADMSLAPSPSVAAHEGHASMQEPGRYPDVGARTLAYAAIKALYTQAIGWLSSREWDRSGDDLYRPDWRDAIIGQATANAWRNVWRFARDDGIYPFAWGTDCLYIASDDPDPVHAKPTALRIGPGLGEWKVKEAAVPLEELLPFLEGEREPVRRLRELQAYLNARRAAMAAPTGASDSDATTEEELD